MNIPNELFEKTPIDRLFSKYEFKGTWEDIPKIGRNNVKALISTLRYREKQQTKSIKYLNEYLTALDQHNFIKQRSNYENPTDMVVELSKASWGTPELEPIDAKSKVRERKSTTYNICGWCNHVSGGTCRYSYSITGSCGLLDTEYDSIKFNTSCLLFNYPKSSAEQWMDYRCKISVQKTDEPFIESKKLTIKELTIHKAKAKHIKKLEEEKKLRDFYRDGIKTLQLFLKIVLEDKPYFTNKRPYDLYNIGDIVNILVSTKFKLQHVIGNWAEGMVVSGYRHGDGCVSYQVKTPVWKSGNIKTGNSTSRPECLLKEEFDYLRKACTEDIDFLNIWLDQIDLRDFNKDNFKMMLQYGAPIVSREGWTPSVKTNIKTKRDAEEALNALDLDLFNTEEKIIKWGTFQLECLSFDKIKDTKHSKVYVKYQRKAIRNAVEFTCNRIDLNKKKKEEIND